MLRELVPLLLQCSTRSNAVGEGTWGRLSFGQLVGKVLLKLCSGERFTQGEIGFFYDEFLKNFFLFVYVFLLNFDILIQIQHTFYFVMSDFDSVIFSHSGV
jgi:hypothetical protein